MAPALVFALALLITVPLLIRAEVLGIKAQIYILKPLSTLLIIPASCLSFLEPGYHPVYSGGILAGLLFSLGGDIALIFQEKKEAFTIGLVLFLVGHLCYTIVFLILGRFTSWDILVAALLLTGALGFYTLIQPNLGSMKIPVIIYMVIITLMVSRSFSTLFSPNFSTRQALMVFSGAFLFYISDLILAANRYWKPWKYQRISLAFYYSGQFLLALAASYFPGL